MSDQRPWPEKMDIDRAYAYLHPSPIARVADLVGLWLDLWSERGDGRTHRAAGAAAHTLDKYFLRSIARQAKRRAVRRNAKRR